MSPDVSFPTPDIDSLCLPSIFLVSLAIGLSVYCSFQRINFWFHWFPLLFCCFQFLFLFLLLHVNACCRFNLLSLFLSLLRWKLRSLIWDFYHFLVQVFNNINYPLGMIIDVSHNFDMLCFYFHSVQNIFNFPCELLFHLLII